MGQHTNIMDAVDLSVPNRCGRLVIFKAHHHKHGVTRFLPAGPNVGRRLAMATWLRQRPWANPGEFPESPELSRDAKRKQMEGWYQEGWWKRAVGDKWDVARR